MARNPIITDEVEALIAKFYYRHDTWKAWEIQKRVSQLLHKNNPELPQNWPGLSAVQKVLAKTKKEKTLYPQDKPWSTAALDSYPELKIESPTPEALSVVLKVWKLRVAQEQGFTIRAAKWAARLSGVLEDIKKLSRYAGKYAQLELIYQLINRPLNTTQLDKEIMAIPYSITSKDGFEGLLPLLAGQEDAIDQVVNLKQGKARGVTVGKEQPPDKNLTKEQILEKSDDILKILAKQEQDWEEFKQEAQNER